VRVLEREREKEMREWKCLKRIETKKLKLRTLK